MELNTIIEAIITGLLGGLFTVIGVKITIANENKWKKREETKKEFNEKPKFKFKKGTFRSDNEADISVFAAPFVAKRDEKNYIQFEYEDKLKNDAEVVCYDYVFENIGKNAATQFSIVINSQKSASIFDYEDKNEWMEKHFINYSSLYDQGTIEPGESIKLRIGYHKDLQFSSCFSATFSILYKDEYGNYWEQPFFERQGKLYEPFKITYKDYLNMVTTQKAMECFENPLLW